MRFWQAKQIFDGYSFLPDNTVLVFDEHGTFIELSDSGKVDQAVIQYAEGILCPGFINVHGHLELSHMLGVIPQQKGFVDFAKHIIGKRNESKQAAIEDAMRQADLLQYRNGIVAAGDISNTEYSFRIKKDSPVYYHTFIELLGLNPNKAQNIYENGLALLHSLNQLGLHGSMAAHAPYSSSRQLINLITSFDKARKLPFTIHNQESEDENLFLQGKTSRFSELYEFLRTDISWFQPQHASALDYYKDLLQNTRSILVHNTFTKESDIHSAPESVFWCFCPNANLYIENRLPDFNLFHAKSNSICFGTDSLASNTKLDITSEANHFLKATGNLLTTLKGLTSNGARALQLDHSFGSFIPGKRVGLNHIDYQSGLLTYKEKLA